MKTRTHTITLVLLCSLVPQALSAQQHNPFGEVKKANENATLNMHLLPEGGYEVSKDPWGDIVRVNMLKIKDWSKVPGVKQAWPMQGYEGVEGMAFHPILSELKDVDGDGQPDIFRCQSEHAGARIERLRYEDGAVVWESEPLGALFGDETRLPVFDLHGNGRFSVLYASRHDHCGKLWCIRADTGATEWCAAYGDGAIKNHGNGQGDVIVGHFLNRQTQAVVVRDGGILRCYNHRGARQWTHDTNLPAGADYAHEIMRCDVDGDGLDEIFANWQKLTMGLRGNGMVLWEDRSQVHHSDFVDYGDVDGDGKIEVIYDHAGCDAAQGPIYVVEPLTGKIKARIDYRKQGVRHAQNIALGNFDKSRKGLEIAFCEKGRDLYLFDGTGTLLWKRPVPASLLSKGDWDGDGVEDIACFALGANVDGMFSVWNGKGERLYAISFLPSPSRRTWSDEHNGGSWSHAMPGGHEGVRRQVDLDGNGRADFIMPFGAWHWGADSILFLMEGQSDVPVAQSVDDLSWLEQYKVVWTSQSKNAGESMPVSGGDIGLNVWVENNELLVYLGRAGYRDENGAILKPGRIRLKLTPNFFAGAEFQQELKLREGHVLVTARRPDGTELTIKVWVEVKRPIVHLDVKSDKPVTAEATYESWRTETIELPNDRSKHDRRAMCMINYDAYPGRVYLYKDEIRPDRDLVRFHHRVDNAKDCFAFQVKQQDLESVRDRLVNPLENLVWGGALVGDDFALTCQISGTYAETPFKGWKYVSKRARSHRIRVCLHIDQVEKQDTWDAALQALIDLSPKDDTRAWKENLSWWSEFWKRSRLVINSGRGEKDVGWRIGRNYQLFRYMLASNVSGREPTLFNGGLFTFDPLYVNGKKGSGYTPDHRQWGAAFTAQNQRMMVWPLLKTGDFDFFPTAFSFYLNGLPNAMARVRHYWRHDGCCFEEQSAITCLPGACQYGFFEGGRRSRAKDFELGVQVNLAGGMVYETQLEYAWLMLRYHQFAGADLRPYLPFIEQSVLLYDEHYRYRCKQLTGQELDEKGKLAIYPANTLEHHPESRNPTSVIAGLQRVLTELIHLPERYSSAEKNKRWQTILDRLPEMPKGNNAAFGGPYLKPSENYEHNSWHCPEMYPLFPYALYGIGLDDLELMQHTSLATGKDRYKTIAWEQANIHAPRLGDTELAQKLNSQKMDNGPYRFPAFWPHTIDWAPDHNWGGSGMIGMQEMVMQTHSTPGKRGKIRLLPAWPKDWDVDFRLHAPYKTTVECKAQSGKIRFLEVTPHERQNDVVLMREGKPQGAALSRIR